MLIKSVLEVVGQTPLLEIDARVHGLKNIKLYAKLEHLNPFGSLKDRPAWNMLSEYLPAVMAAGQTVIESSSGNMAKAMQTICSMHGVPFRVVTNRIHVTEVKQMLQLLGAEVNEFPGMSSCPDPSDPNNPVAFIEREIAAHPGKYFHTTQYTNDRNTAAHQNKTGPEIVADLGGAKPGAAKVDYFIAGLGTTGSSRGVSEHLRSLNKDLSIVGVVAKKGQVIPGIRNADEMYEVGLFKKDMYKEVVEVDVAEAIDGVLTLCRKLGVLAGPTSGAAYAAALKHLRAIDAQLTEPRTAVFIVCDRVEPYLSYLQKYRPELFGVAGRRKESARTVSAEVIARAPEVTVDKVTEWLAASAGGSLVVDMRGSLAFKASRISGSINLPAEQLEDMSERGVPFATSQRVLFVCPTGDQSRRFAAYFASQGVDCASLTGGFIAWRDSGKPLEKPVLVKAKEV